MNKPRESIPASVPDGARQAGEVRARWACAEPLVWTDRMLTALESGVKGGKWFSLIDKVHRASNLRAAFARVKSNDGAAGVDHETVEMFEKNLDANLERLSGQLRTGTYRPQAVRRVWIPKPGGREKRPLGIPTVRDRVAQTALRNVVEPIFERDFSEHSYGFRPGRSCRDALRYVDGLLEDGAAWVVDADLKSYFDTIDHELLMARVKEKITDGAVLALIETFLDQRVLDTMNSWASERGTPQGAVISPLLANIFLDPLDRMMARRGFEMVRYADDFVILCRSEAEARKALEVVEVWTTQARLTLHPDKTCIVDASEPGGFDFLGYHFERGYHWPSKKSERKLKDAIRGKTHRANGHSLDQIIKDVNRTAQGWFGYFKYSWHTTYEPIDGWIRMRLRSILRKRKKRKGRGRGADHQRWPNAYFAEHGLFSLAAAHAEACQSAKR